MPSFLTALFVCMAFVLSQTAPAQAQSSYTGATQGFVGEKRPPARATPPEDYAPVPTKLPPVFDNVAPPPLPATATAADGDTAVEDPCSAYTDSYDSYTLCQDRNQKIQRMKDAKAKRQAADARRSGKEPVAPPVAETPKAETEKPAADTRTADGAEEPPKELTPTEKALDARAKAVEKKSIGVK